MIWTAIWLFAKWQRNIDREFRGGPTESDTADLDPNQQDIDWNYIIMPNFYIFV